METINEREEAKKLLLELEEAKEEIDKTVALFKRYVELHRKLGLPDNFEEAIKKIGKTISLLKKIQEYSESIEYKTS